MTKGTGEAFVYYIRRGDLIKIGASANIRVRLSAQAYDELLAVEPGYFSVEKQRHRQFAEHKEPLGRGQHEWFKPGDTLLAHIAAMRALHDLPDLSTRTHPHLSPTAKAMLTLLPPPLIQVPADAMDRFVARITIDGDCWRRSATLDVKGYGQFFFDGSVHRSHRLSYRMFVGPIPDGLEIDHVKVRGCRFKDCIRPSHLEAVTSRENTLRSGNMGAINASATHCPAGHEYTPETTYLVKSPNGRDRRQCKICTREKAHERHHRLKTDPAYREQRRLSQRKRRTPKPRKVPAERRKGTVPRQPKTHCPNGHLLSDDNVYWRKARGPRGKPTRQCKTCAKERRSAAYWKDREPAPPRAPKPKTAGPKRQPQALRTHCPNGHEYTPANIYWSGPKKNRRNCKICALARAKAQRDARRVTPGPIVVSSTVPRQRKREAALLS